MLIIPVMLMHVYPGFIAGKVYNVSLKTWYDPGYAKIVILQQNIYGDVGYTILQQSEEGYSAERGE